MKKILLALLILLAPWFSRAEVVPQESAKATAERFLKEVAPARTPRLQLAFEAPRMTKSVSVDPAYFIFADEAGGYVIAAGDNTVPAVLGYATSGQLRTGDLPANMLSWLDMWRDIIEANRASGAAPWKEPARTKAGGKSKQLETALWGQSSPFNDLCITLGGKHALTGCTATATAILMRYHKWPDKGVGTLPAYEFTEKGGSANHTQSAITLGHTYQWDQMPLQGMSNWTSTQKTAVATLMRDCAVMLQSTFGIEETSAYINDIPTGLSTYMKYDASISLDRLYFYDSPEEWTLRIERNIDENGPVVYAGYTEKSGHAFIVDGYDELDYLHVNWGWNGDENGYFVVPEFHEYTTGHIAVVGAKKDAGGKASPDIQIYNMEASVTSFSQGVDFTTTVEFYNMGYGDYNGAVAIAKFDRNGDFVELVSGTVEIADLGYTWGWSARKFTCRLSSHINAGDYITLVCRPTGASGWTPARYDHDNAVGRIIVGDSVLLDKSIHLEYSVSQGRLTVTFDCSCSRELRSGGSAVSTGVSDSGNKMTVDATKLKAGTYILHVQRGEQVKDITLHLGLK